MTQHYKFPFIVLIALLLGVWAGHNLFPATENGNAVAIQKSHNAFNNNANENVLITQLEEEIKTLQEKNRRLTQQLLQYTSKETPQKKELTENTDHLEQLNSKIDTLEMEKQQRKANDINHWIMEKQKNNEKFNFNSELAQRFEQESINPEWAEQQENYYRQLFSSQDNLRDFALRDTQCRSTQCAVTFSISNAQQSQQLLHAISNELKNTEVLIATDEIQGVSKLYISSNKKGFEFN